MNGAPYTLTIEASLRQVSTRVCANDDRQAVRKAAELVWATCSTADGLGERRVRLTRSDGSDVAMPKSVASLAARA